MSERRRTVSTSVNFTQLLTLLFIGLKLTNQIDWSWWWVFSPLLISFVLGVLAILILIAFD